MYLINVNTMQLEFFHESSQQQYAIISHRWQDGEVLFQDIQSGEARQKAGYAKLQAFCTKAAEANYTYAWCDTCCIDKSSSAELSESINSMFKWYRDAAVCFAYMHDVAETVVTDSAGLRSEWFTRGWCLQELVAPREMLLFNGSWAPLGSRESLSIIISEITGIDIGALGGDMEAFSVAQRMSWAADRITTRSEDIAYSLLGIFNVSMPLLYGEGGGRAFRRLQEEIVKQSPDQSILIHSHADLFAQSPNDFRDSTRIICAKVPLTGEPYSVTNMGLSVSLLLFPWAPETYLALLDCQWQGCDGYVGIFVHLRPRKSHWVKTDHAVRISVDGDLWLKQPRIDGLPRSVSRLFLEYSLGQVKLQGYGFWVRRFEEINDKPCGQRKIWAVSHNQWDEKQRLVTLPSGTHGTAGIIAHQQDEDDGYAMLLRLGFTSDFRPILELGGDAYICLDKNPAGATVEIKGPDNFPIDGRYDHRSEYRDRTFTKEWVLSSTQWMGENTGRGRHPSRVLVECESRDTPLRSKGNRGLAGWYELFCRKMVVDGVEMWVVDVEWWGYSGNRNLGNSRGANCDCCEKEIRGERYKCQQCEDYDLCMFCINDKERIHDVNHELKSI